MLLLWLFYVNIGAVICYRKQQQQMHRCPAACSFEPFIGHLLPRNELSIEPPLGGGGGIHTAYKPPMCGYQPTHHGWMLFVVCVVMRWDWRDACSKTQKDTFNTLNLVPYNEVKIIFDSGINLQVLAALTLTWRYNQLKVFLLPGCWQTTCCPWQCFQAYLLLASVCP